MQPTIHELSRRVAAAITEACGIEPSQVDPRVGPSQDTKFGDYQSNCAMGLARALKAKPRDIAQRIVDVLDWQDICEPPEIAGPGFINLRLTPKYVAAQLASVPTNPGNGQDRLGIATTEHPTVVVVDMASPNLAKEMHVGHLRSTVIGDCVARLLEFDGHDVRRINHVGDWGTQFGMLLAYLRRTQPEVLDDPSSLRIDDLETFYVSAKRMFDDQPEFAERSRKTVVELQSGEPAVLAVWQAFCNESLRHCHEVFDRLNITVEDRGESYYRSMLADVVTAFVDRKLAVESDGAMCVFLDGFTSREGAPLPMMIRKSDGGYNYDTTDLAAIRHRIETLGAKTLLYVVGVAQKQHFDMLFAAARKIGWAGEDVTLDHLGFGNMLGADGRPFKTRTGGTIKLKDLIAEAVSRARRIVERNVEAGGARSDFDEATVDAIAEAVGIGAIKYFDLSHSLGSDYKFDWDTMLAMEGNTAPYMLYAYARILSIGRKAGINYADLPADAPIVLAHESEIKLGKSLLRFAETLHLVSSQLRPNILTDYLYDLSKAFSLFYDRRRGVRVIDAESDAIRLSRLRLCDLTARTLKTGLGLLGIRTVDRM